MPPVSCLWMRLQRVFWLNQSIKVGEKARTHVELPTMLLSQVHTFNAEFVKVFKLGTSSGCIKGGLGCILIKLEDLWKELP